MSISRHISILALVLVLMSTAASSQDSLSGVRIGAGIGGELGSAGGSLSIYPDGAACGTYGDASVRALTANLSLAHTRLISEALGVAVRLGVRLLSAAHSAAPVDPQRALNPGTLQLVDVDRRFELSGDYTALAADVLARLSVGAISILVGPTASFWIAGQGSAADRIAAPDWATHADGSRERPFVGAALPTRGGFAPGAVLEVAYDVPLSPSMIIVPHVGGRVDLTGPYDGAEWTGIEGTAGISLEWALPRADAPAPPPPPPAPPVREIPPPVVSLGLAAADSTGVTSDTLAVITDRFVLLRNLPLVPAVFFDTGSDSLPVRYVRLASEHPRTFSPASLSGVSDLDAQRQILNVIGSRMAADRSLRLTLVGSTSTEEAGALAARRVATVRDYLLTAWGIDRSRIVNASRGVMPPSNEATEAGKAENRRVELTASDPALLAGIETDSTVERRLIPLLHLRVFASSPVGVRSWITNVDIPGHGVVSIASGDSSDLPFENSIRLPGRSANTIKSGDALLGTLRAVDTRGVSSETRDDLPVVVREHQTIVEGWRQRSAEREVTTFAVLGFGFDSPALVDRHRREIAVIARRVRNGSRISVTGYSDRLGDEGRNVELSQERAASVTEFLAAELGALGVTPASLTHSGAGADDTRFANDLPEGRMLSRGVVVVVDD